jgi:hypothetical protein
VVVAVNETDGSRGVQDQQMPAQWPEVSVSAIPRTVGGVDPLGRKFEIHERRSGQPRLIRTFLTGAAVPHCLGLSPF